MSHSQNNKIKTKTKRKSPQCPTHTHPNCHTHTTPLLPICHTPSFPYIHVALRVHEKNALCHLLQAADEKTRRFEAESAAATAARQLKSATAERDAEVSVMARQVRAAEEEVLAQSQRRAAAEARLSEIAELQHQMLLMEEQACSKKKKNTPPLQLQVPTDPCPDQPKPSPA